VGVAALIIKVPSRLKEVVWCGACLKRLILLGLGEVAKATAQPTKILRLLPGPSAAWSLPISLSVPPPAA
jgi:hypothetical protein